MTDLQLSLIIIGALAIGAVYLFNRLQERKHRREAEQAFASQARDVLLEKTPRETQWPAPAPKPPEPAAETADSGSYREPVLGLDHEAKRGALEFNREIDYVAVLQGDAHVSGRQIKDAVDKYRFSAKPVRWLGKADGVGTWQEVAGPGQQFSHLRVGLQLANRKGPAGELDLASFVGMAKNVAAELGMRLQLADEKEALERANELDKFLSEVDLLIGVNVVSSDGTPLHATKIRALAEAEGMSLGQDGAFHFRNEHNQSQFTLVNQEPRPFQIENIKNMTTPGVTFLLDVPRAADGSRALDKMVVVARNFAHALHGIVVDDKRQPLLDPEVKRIRADLDGIYGRMSERGIPAGGDTAARLFTE
jgi:FtsZ-interacting cell division protein ZipA